ncbi:MAG: sulfotransferase [Arenicellales bacterium]
MTNIIFIASLDHSGSTMLDNILANHSQMVGLGEIEYVIKQYINFPNSVEIQKCSCEIEAEKCAFWGEVILRFRKENHLTLPNGYEIVIEVFNKIYGESAILVDSSKYRTALRVLKELPAVNVQVLHLLKDVRAYTISRLDRAREKFGKNGFLLPHKQFRHWIRVNRSLLNILEDSNMPFMRVGYEEICLDPVGTLNKVCTFIDVKFEHSMLELNKGGGHCLVGNRMRLQNKNRRLIYDSRWFSRNEWLMPSIIFPEIMKFNSEYVYSNRIDKLFMR